MEAGTHVAENDIPKSHVLILSSNTGLAEGLARLLSPDDRYEVRRAAHSSEIDGFRPRWRLDVVLVDGSLIGNGSGPLALPAPVLLVAAGQDEADRLRQQVPSARGWVRLDPTYGELERALASAGAAPRVATLRSRFVAGVVFVVAASGATAACAWLLLN